MWTANCRENCMCCEIQMVIWIGNLSHNWHFCLCQQLIPNKLDPNDFLGRINGNVEKSWLLALLFHLKGAGKEAFGSFVLREMDTSQNLKQWRWEEVFSLWSQRIKSGERKNSHTRSSVLGPNSPQRISCQACHGLDFSFFLHVSVCCRNCSRHWNLDPHTLQLPPTFKKGQSEMRSQNTASPELFGSLHVYAAMGKRNRPQETGKRKHDACCALQDPFPHAQCAALIVFAEISLDGLWPINASGLASAALNSQVFPTKAFNSLPSRSS